MTNISVISKMIWSKIVKPVRVEKENIRSKLKCFDCMQFGLFTHPKTENHSVPFTWSNSNKRFLGWAKANKQSLYLDEHSASLFHFWKRCASCTIYQISLISPLFILFQSPFKLTWIEKRSLASLPICQSPGTLKTKWGHERTFPILLSAFKDFSWNRNLVPQHCWYQATYKLLTYTKVRLWKCLQGDRHQRHLIWFLIGQRYS